MELNDNDNQILIFLSLMFFLKMKHWVEDQLGFHICLLVLMFIKPFSLTPVAISYLLYKSIVEYLRLHDLLSDLLKSTLKHLCANLESMTMWKFRPCHFVGIHVLCPLLLPDQNSCQMNRILSFNDCTWVGNHKVLLAERGFHFDQANNVIICCSCSRAVTRGRLEGGNWQMCHEDNCGFHPDQPEEQIAPNYSSSFHANQDILIRPSQNEGAPGDDVRVDRQVPQALEPFGVLDEEDVFDITNLNIAVRQQPQVAAMSEPELGFDNLRLRPMAEQQDELQDFASGNPVTVAPAAEMLRSLHVVERGHLPAEGVGQTVENPDQ